MRDILNKAMGDKLRSYLNKYPQIIAGYLFGSRIKKTNLPSSDLDLGLICLNKKNLPVTDIFFDFKKFFPEYILDPVILDLNNNPLVLIQVINGKQIYQYTLSDRLDLETRIIYLFEDYRNYQKINRYYLDKSFKEGIYAS